MISRTTRHPETWVVLKINTDTDPVYKVLGEWSDGFWRVLFHVELVFERERTVDFYGESGTLYHCQKDSYGLAMSMEQFNSFNELSYEAELMPEDTNWSELV